MDIDSSRNSSSLRSSSSLESRKQSHNKCPICQGSFKDPVRISCKGAHRFCFTCIIKWIEKQGKVEDSCPLCRGGDKYIILGTEPVKAGYRYRDLYHFLLSKPILEKVINMTPKKNSNLVPERILLTYILNEKPLQFALESHMDDDDIIKHINWVKPPYEDRCIYCSYSTRYRPRLTVLSGDIGPRVPLSNTSIISQRTHTQIPSPPPGNPPDSSDDDVAVTSNVAVTTSNVTVRPTI